MLRTRFALLGIILFIVAYSGCDDGLHPDPFGFSGVIRFKNWPREDSVDLVVQELRLVAFRKVPSDTANLVLSYFRSISEGKGDIIIFPPVGSSAFSKREGGRLRDSIQYTVTLPGTTPSRYAYVAVAWRYGTNFFSDWRPAGIYQITPDTSYRADTVVVPRRTYVSGIDLNCDFRNPPPRPWGR